MADSKLSDLTAVTAVADADLLLVAQGGVSKKATAALVRTAPNGGNNGLPGFRALKVDGTPMTLISNKDSTNDVVIDPAGVSSYVHFGMPAASRNGPNLLLRNGAGVWAESFDFGQDIPLIKTDSSNNVRVGHASGAGSTQENDVYLDVQTGKTIRFDVNGTDVAIATAAGLQNTVGEAALALAFTKANATFGNTNLSFTVVAGRSYRIAGYLIVSNTTAGEGAKFDFAGGAATATTFDVALNAIGTNTPGTVVSAALATVLNYSSVTGTNRVFVSGYLKVNAGGTLIFRAAENSTATGTMTLAAGSWLALSDTVDL